MLKRIQLLSAEDIYGLSINGDGGTAVMDSGCSTTTLGDRRFIEEGTLEKLPQPVEVGGLSGNMAMEYRARGHFEVLTMDGGVEVLRPWVYFNENLGELILLSPQQLFEEYDDDNAEFVVKRRMALLRINRSEIQAPLNHATRLPTLQVFRDAKKTAREFAMNGCVTDAGNQNLTAKQKLLLRYHYRLGHMAMNLVRWMGRQGWLGKQGELMGTGNLEHPKCAACLYGKQHKTTQGGQHSSKDETGALSKDHLKPGDLIFSDQYQSRTPGRTLESRGGSNATQYYGGTLFYDAASRYISVHHQVGLSAVETIASKIQFEREAHSVGVTPKLFHTDNGIFLVLRICQ